MSPIKKGHQVEGTAAEVVRAIVGVLLISIHPSSLTVVSDISLLLDDNRGDDTTNLTPFLSAKRQEANCERGIRTHHPMPSHLLLLTCSFHN